MKNIIIITILLFCILQSTAETNQVFVTVDPGYITASGGYVLVQETNEATKKLESLPAKDFPQGNWGAETGGFQLSCRFEKTMFTNGEPMIAIVLVRNVSTNQLGYSADWVHADGPIDLVITTEKGQAIPQNIYWGESSGRRSGIRPGTQLKYNESLNLRYTLTNGTYLVNARLGLRWDSQKKAGVFVESGKAKITIVPAK